VTMTIKQKTAFYGKFLDQYSAGMLERLIEKHNEKRPWTGESPFYLYEQLREKMLFFENAMENNDLVLARKLVFDIGNFSWMILDRLEMLAEVKG